MKGSGSLYCLPVSAHMSSSRSTGHGFDDLFGRSGVGEGPSVFHPEVPFGFGELVRRPSPRWSTVSPQGGSDSRLCSFSSLVGVSVSVFCPHRSRVSVLPVSTAASLSPPARLRSLGCGGPRNVAVSSRQVPPGTTQPCTPQSPVQRPLNSAVLSRRPDGPWDCT